MRNRRIIRIVKGEREGLDGGGVAEMLSSWRGGFLAGFRGCEFEGFRGSRLRLVILVPPAVGAD